MTRTSVPLACFSVLVGSIAVGQSTRFSCVEPPQLRELNLTQVRARLSGGQNDFFLYKRLEDLTPIAPKPGTLAPEFQEKLTRHANDVRFVYLYGRSLIGKNTPEAVAQLNRASALDPEMPWTYAALATIYASHNFKDDARLLANMRAYRKLCPENLHGFEYFNILNDQAETAEWARQLRSLLEHSSDPSDSKYWKDLWAAEFRTTALSQFDALRKRVAVDVQRLETRPEPRKQALLEALLDGYNLTRQTQSAKWIEQRLDPDEGVRTADNALYAKYGLSRTTRMTPQQYEAFMKERATLFAERVVKSPASTRAWIGRLNSLGFEPNWTKQEMEQAGEGLLKADAARERGWTYAPMELIVAQAWVASGIRPKDCVDLADQALAEISLGPEIPNDLDAGLNAAQMAAQGLFGFNSELWNAMDVVLDASLQLRDLDKAYRMLAKMQQWLADNQVLRDNPTSGFARFRGNWLNSTGKVAEAEGQRLDALALYTKAIADGAVDPALAKHARSLWDEMGGTEERWKLVTARLPASKPPTTATGNASSSSPKTPAESVSGTRPEPAAWIEVNRPLPQMDLRDLTGQSWTVANFKGKTTLISLWATWCLPCRDELPSVQKLFDLTKGRADIQVITLNVDDDPGLVEPFMTENHFSFPVLLSAGHYVEAMDGLPIPQTWLVDQKANLREKSLGFNPKVTDWSSETLERLKHLGQ